MKRGQSAIEFVTLVSFMIVVFFVFFIIIQNRIVDLAAKQDVLYLKEANNIVVSEVELAFSAAPDFEHSFIIPNKGSLPFLVNITNNREVVSSFGSVEYVNFFPFNVTGHLNGLDKDNMIYSTDGIVIFPNTTEVINNSYSGIFLNLNPETCHIAHVMGLCGDVSVISSEMVPLCSQYFSLC